MKTLRQYIDTSKNILVSLTKGNSTGFILLVSFDNKPERRQYKDYYVALRNFKAIVRGVK